MRIIDLIRGDPAAGNVVPPTGFTVLLTTISAAAMAFLAVFAIALALAAGKLASRWEAELAGTATVRVAPVDGEAETRVSAVLQALSQTPGIATVRRVTESEQAALLAPWFGEDLPLDQLHLPVLIEVTESEPGPDLTGLRQRLEAEAPGTVYDDHDRWRLPLIAAAGRLRVLGYVALALIGSVMAVTIALAASAALAANGQIIDVLRLVGARDAWITRAFVRRFTLRVFLGALAGTVAAMIVVALIPGGTGAGILSGLSIRGVAWFWPLLVPVVATALAWVATVTAAARRLRKAL